MLSDHATAAPAIRLVAAVIDPALPRLAAAPADAPLRPAGGKAPGKRIAAMRIDGVAVSPIRLGKAR